MGIEVVDISSIFFKSDVFQDSTEFHGVIDLGLFIRAETDTFSIAASFDVEDSLVSPDVLVITDQFTIADCAQCSFSGS